MKTGFGLLMIALGAALGSLSDIFGGTAFQDFLFELLQFVTLASMLLGAYAAISGIASNFIKRKKRQSC